MSTQLVVLALALSIGLAAVISEASFKPSLTDRGRVVIPLFLGVTAWLAWLVLEFVKGWWRP